MCSFEDSLTVDLAVAWTKTENSDVPLHAGCLHHRWRIDLIPLDCDAGGDPDLSVDLGINAKLKTNRVTDNGLNLDTLKLQACFEVEL